MTMKKHLAMTKRSIQRMFELDKAYLTAEIVSSVMEGCIPYITIYMSAKIVDELIYNRSPEKLMTYIVFTVGMTFALQLLKRLFEKIKSYHEELFFYNIHKTLSDKSMELDYARIENVETQRMLEQIKVETQMGHGLGVFSSAMEYFIISAVQMVCSLVITIPLLASKSVTIWMKLGLVLLLAGIIAVNYYVNEKKQRIYMGMFDECVPLNVHSNYLSSYTENYKSGMETRLYGMTELVAEADARLNRKFNHIMLRSQKKQLKFSVLNDLVMQFLNFGSYMIVIAVALIGDITIGSIAKYVSSVAMLVSSVLGMFSMIQYIKNNYVYMEHYFNYFDIPSEMYHGKLPVEKRAFCDGGDNEYEIEFRDVSFKYPGAETYALRHVSLKFRIGEKMAIVGQNGSGKTTFIKLLCRLYDPTEGQILLNGVDIRKYDYDEYMSVFSMVFQDFKLFSFSLAQNVASSVEYNRKWVERCLKKAGFEERLKKMPKGLETCLYKDFDENGVEVSGGEAQKIALARALYKDAPFIVLDEPTAALDPVAEFEIYSKFNEIVEDKTAIYISHRLSSCRFCNDIAVFDHGQLVQRGNHEELVGDENGKYYELWTAQAQYYAENKTQEIA